MCDGIQYRTLVFLLSPRNATIAPPFIRFFKFYSDINRLFKNNRLVCVKLGKIDFINVFKKRKLNAGHLLGDAGKTSIITV